MSTMVLDSVNKLSILSMLSILLAQLLSYLISKCKLDRCISTVILRKQITNPMAETDVQKLLVNLSQSLAAACFIRFYESIKICLSYIDFTLRRSYYVVHAPHRDLHRLLDYT